MLSENYRGVFPPEVRQLAPEDSTFNITVQNTAHKGLRNDGASGNQYFKAINIFTFQNAPL